MSLCCLIVNTRKWHPRPDHSWKTCAVACVQNTVVLSQWKGAVQVKWSQITNSAVSLFLKSRLTGIVAWHVSWLIHLGGGGCQCGCGVIYTTPTYVPEHIYPCGPGAHTASSPEDVRVCVCTRVDVCAIVRTLVSAIMRVQQEVVLGSLGARFQVPGPVYCHKFQNGDYLLQK